MRSIAERIKESWPMLVSACALMGMTASAMSSMDERNERVYAHRTIVAELSADMSHVEADVNKLSDNLERIEIQQDNILEKLNILIGGMQTTKKK